MRSAQTKGLRCPHYSTRLQRISALQTAHLARGSATAGMPGGGVYADRVLSNAAVFTVLDSPSCRGTGVALLPHACFTLSLDVGEPGRSNAVDTNEIVHG